MVVNMETFDLDTTTKTAQEIVRSFLYDHHLVGQACVVAVSGGPDSVALLLLLHELAEPLKLHLIVAHLNHQLRGQDANLDEAYVHRLAQRLQLPFFSERADINALAARPGSSLEEAARQYRYAFLGRIALQVGSKAVFVGHNADDQVETVLMHFLRGSGLAGLRGMLPSTPLAQLRLPLLALSERSSLANIWLYRPLLAVPRSTIIHLLYHLDITPRFDRSNLDTTYFRNRLRHELLPHLKTYNPRISNALWQMSVTIQDDYAFLAEAMEVAWRMVCRIAAENVVICDLASWRTLHRAQQRSVLRRAAWQLRRQLRDFDFQAVEQARYFVSSPENHAGQQISLPGRLRLSLGYDCFVLHDAQVDPPATGPQLLVDELALSLPGETILPSTDWRLQVEEMERDALPANWPADRWQTWIDADKIRAPLLLRRRRPGDRFLPWGMAGHRVKIADLMINGKVPRWERERWPLLGSGADILWVPGVRAGAMAAVNADSTHLLHLYLSRLSTEDTSILDAVS